MIRFRCTCSQKLIEQEQITALNIGCKQCKKTYTWFNGEYREYEVAQLVDRFTPRELSGIGLANKIKRGIR